MAWTSPPTENRTVAILGAGVLGRRIGAAWAASGYRVCLRDPDAAQRAQALEYIRGHVQSFRAAADGAQARVDLFEEVAPAVAAAFLVIECVPEKLELKRATFAALEALAPADAVLATNSSSYKSRELVPHLRAATRRRVLNMHYMMPPGNNVVELMTCGDTDPAIFPWLLARLRGLGMLPVQARQESTGFVINRVWAAIKRECLMVLAEGVATPADLDAVWGEMFLKNGWPPCVLMDKVGLDTVALIEKHYIDERALADRGVLPFLQRHIDDGRLGTKSNKGGLHPPGHAEAVTAAAEEKK